jgi:glyoxylase-like metal-dependent hydrolase (beta-lactamase superfamily II)
MYMCNCYLVYDDVTGTGIVIDPGDEAQVIVDEINKRGLGITTIVDTHGHPDHVAANAAVADATNARIAIHEADSPMLSNKDYAYALGITEFRESTADVFLDEGDTVSVGSESLMVIHTPGHTPGGICLIAESEAYVGDTVFAGSIGRTDLGGGSLRILTDSINRKIMVLPEDTTLYPGHGPLTTVSAEKNSNPFL